MLIFDCGSNATKASLELDGRIIRNWRMSTKLGADLCEDGALSESAIARQCDVIKQILDESQRIVALRGMYALGTEALRTAVNAQKLVERLATQFGLTLEIISGEREAELEKIAIWHCAARCAHPNEFVLAMDSGGSSTEFSLISPLGVTLAQMSAPFGQHAIGRALKEGAALPFGTFFIDLNCMQKIRPDLIIVAGSSFTAYARYALNLDVYCDEAVESQRLERAVLVPKEDLPARCGEAMLKALTLSAPVYVTTYGIRHGWLFERSRARE